MGKSFIDYPAGTRFCEACGAALEPLDIEDGGVLWPLDKDRLARADGFQDWGELLEFFRDVHGLPFEGVLIAW